MKDEDITDWRNRIARAWDAGDEQRDECNEDIRFCHVTGGMWEDWMNEVYGDDADRVRIEFDIASDFVNGFVGEWKDNRAGVYFSPDDDETSDDDADRITGIYRADFNDNGGKPAVDLAVEEMAECGIGHFQIKTEFENSDDPEDERQKVCWKPIYNSYSYVVWDENAKDAVKSEAKWCAVLTPYNTKEAYDAAYPKAESELSAYEPHTRSWLQWNTNEVHITVAEVYEIKQKTTLMHVYGNQETGTIKAFPDDEINDIKDELKEDWIKIRERKMTVQTVEKTVFNGAEILEKTARIPGKYIPIIPVYGYRKYIDGKERVRGLVRKLKDPNRAFNMTVSRMAESSAASPDEVPIFLREQLDEQLKQNWADKTNKSFQMINALKDANGNPMAVGPVGMVKATPIDPNTLATAEMTTAHVQSVTGGTPQDTIDPQASGKAINALIKRENRKTNVLNDNINGSMAHSAKVYLSIAEEIYTQEMSKRILAEDNTASTIRLNEAVYDDEKKKFVHGQDISGKKYKVSARIGPQFETQREATVETVERAMAMVGEGSPHFDPLLMMWAKNIHGTGLDDFKEYMRRKAILMGIQPPETDEEKEMVAMLAQQQGQQDPTQILQLAAAQQQMAEAKSMEAGAIDKIASAEKKAAETQKVQAETVKLLEEVGKDPDGVTRLRFNPETGQLEGANSNRVTGTG